jgi:hypothetical protein
VSTDERVAILKMPSTLRFGSHSPTHSEAGSGSSSGPVRTNEGEISGLAHADQAESNCATAKDPAFVRNFLSCTLVLENRRSLALATQTRSDSWSLIGLLLTRT